MNSEIVELLQEKPFNFNFFQAVHLLERLLPNRFPVGKFVAPSSEAVHFGANPSLAFPASEIQSFEWTEGEIPEMTVNFMGLTGPLGIMPLYYTELVAARLKDGDRALAAFLDIFNHRLISLFYRAWAKYRFTVAYEESEADRLSLQLLALVGLGTPGLQGRHPLPDDSFIYYAGMLMRHSRSASNLKQLIADYFDVNVDIDEFAGGWHKLDVELQTCLDETGDDSSKLSFGVIAGDEIWQDESSVRIKIGPLPLQQYLEFLPGGGAYESLRALTRFFCGDEIDCEIQLMLKRNEVPSCELGADGQATPKLGWVSWIKSVPFAHETADTILHF